MPTPLPARAVALAVFALAASSASAVPLVGLTSANELARFDSADVGSATRIAITGLDAGDRFVGIDLRPGNNRIYGITVSNRLYTLDERTGAASFVAALSAPIVGGSLGWGIDFNPVADFAGAASLRFVSSAGGNFAINADTGAVGNAANTIAPGFTAVAYANSVPNPVAAPPGTALYYIDSTTDTLSRATTAFNTPTITPIGALGVDVLRANGFELLADGRGFAALNVDGGSLATGLYGIDIGTGAASLLGTFDGTLTGLTVSAVPEPGTAGLLGAGLLAMGAALRRRRIT